MLTIEALQNAGVNTQEGLARCLNNEQFYLSLIQKALAGDDCERLKSAIEAGDLEGAFSIAHNLKGMMGNLALTPVYEPVVQMTELLRSRTQTDYSTYLETITENRQMLLSLCD